MNQRNRVSFFNILSTCLLYGISIFTAPLFSRLLGTGGYGNVSNYNVWVSVLAIAATMQTQGTLVNARVEYPEETQIRYQSSVMSLSFLVFAGVTALVLLFLEPISSSLDLSKFFILLVLFQAIGTYGVNFMNTKLTYELKAGRNMLLSVGTSLGTLVLSLILVLTLPKEINYYGRILAIALVYGLLGLSLCLYVFVKGKTFYNREFWRFCIPLAIPYVFYNLADLLLGHSDVVMLRQLSGEGCQRHLLHGLPVRHHPLHPLRSPEQYLGALLLRGHQAREERGGFAAVQKLSGAVHRTLRRLYPPGTGGLSPLRPVGFLGLYGPDPCFHRQSLSEFPVYLPHQL